MAKMGRPTDYTPELVAKICTQLAMGKSLRTVCKQEGMPSGESVFTWLRLYPEFLVQYEKAKQEATDALAEEIMDIADEGTEDVQRSRLRVDTRKWLMAKMKPKKYGEQLDLTTNGKDIPAPIYGGKSANS